MTSIFDQILTSMYKFERDNIETPKSVKMNKETWNRLRAELAPDLVQFDNTANGPIKPRFHGFKVEFVDDIADGDFKWVM